MKSNRMNTNQKPEPLSGRIADVSEIRKEIDVPVLKVRIHKNRKDHSFRTLLLFLILFFCTAATLIIKAEALHERRLQSGIAGQIIRFHVIANSDTEQDQALKLAVRDALITELEPLLEPTDTLKEAQGIITSRISDIKALAEATVRDRGYDYPIQVSLTECFFPLKIYGAYTFPPGYYEALRVEIGNAEGKNWWCVMFPPLCFVDETFSIVDEASGKKLKNLLTDEEYNVITDKDTPVRIRFKLWESIKDFFN